MNDLRSVFQDAASFPTNCNTPVLLRKDWWMNEWMKELWMNESTKECTNEQLNEWYLSLGNRHWVDEDEFRWNWGVCVRVLICARIQKSKRDSVYPSITSDKNKKKPRIKMKVSWNILKPRMSEFCGSVESQEWVGNWRTNVLHLDDHLEFVV